MPTTYRSATGVWLGIDNVVYTSSPPDGAVVIAPADTDYTIPEYTNAGVPVAEFNGIASEDALCIDTTNNTLYRNVGTRAANIWALIGAKV